MSLINDALRRAKQVQQEAPAPLAGPPLRPVEPIPYIRHGVGFLVPVSITLVALLGLLLLWQLYERRVSDKVVEPIKHAVSGAQSATVVEPVVQGTAGRSGSPLQNRANTTTISESAPRPEVTRPAVSPAPAAAVNPTPLDVGLAATTNATPQNNAVTNQPSALPPAAPKPAPLKLQGIIFNPKRLSAVINGRTLFLGDRIDQFRVASIHQDSVTLVGTGRTNILSLEP
jgi:hypothetical protein